MGIVAITKVSPEEIPVLSSIGRRTFEGTFAADNDPGDLAAYLDQAFSHAQLERELSDPGTTFYFAKVDGEVCGYLKLNRGDAQTENVEGRTLEIERIYVDDGRQGQGVGKALFGRAVENALANDDEAVWLGVWERNPKAIEFYRRQGFVEFGEHRFRIGSELQRDILMRLDFHNTPDRGASASH